MENKYLKFIRNSSGYLKVTIIEKELGMPDATLRRFVSGERGLSAQWEKPLEKWLKKFLRDVV